MWTDLMAPAIPQPPPPFLLHDHYHRLLSTRYVCKVCLTRYFSPYGWCRACRQRDCIVALDPSLADRAQSDTQLRAMIRGESN